MILVIDNYDSFTYNLVQRLGEIDPALDVRVVRNDELSAEEIEALQPERMIVSPGPCTPNEAGVSVEAIQRMAGKIPILGVCLGHQSMGQAYGATIVRAKNLMHGKVDQIHHSGEGVLAGIEDPFQATRYHSLVIDPDTLPDEFIVTAWPTSLMAVARSWPLSIVSSSVRGAVPPGELPDASWFRFGSAVSWRCRVEWWAIGGRSIEGALRRRSPREFGDEASIH